MEANEAHELQEHAEHGAHEASMRPVAFTMAVLAVLVAITTVLGHRTHTEAVLDQNRATDQWNEYQAKKIRQHEEILASNQLSHQSATLSPDEQKDRAEYKAHIGKWNDDLDEDSKKAKEFEAKVAKSARAH